MYPLFVPPDDLSIKDRKKWTKNEAREYFSWLINAQEARVENLLNYFGHSSKELSAAETLLSNLGTEVSRQLKLPNFSCDNKLTDAGYALSADIGLLIAKLLRNANSEIHWKIIFSPKSAHSINFPVLKGFQDGLFLDPVLGSIGESFGILRGSVDNTIWKNMYLFWLEKSLKFQQ